MNEFSNDERELMQRLKRLTVPDPGEAYWSAQVARIRTELASHASGKVHVRKIWLAALAGSFASAVLVALLFLAAGWRFGSTDAVDEETARFSEEPFMAADWTNLDEQSMARLYSNLTDNAPLPEYEGESIETGPADREMNAQGVVDDSAEVLTDEEFNSLLNQIERIQI